MMQVEHLKKATFGSIVTGVDLENLDETTWGKLYNLWIERALLIFPRAFLSAEGQDILALRFGDIEFPRTAISNIGKDEKLHHESSDDVVKVLRGNEGWHHDSTYMPIQAKAAIFCAEIVPDSGGETGWADMRAAYEALDETVRVKVENLKAYHSYYYSQGRDGYLPNEQNEDGTYNYYGFHDHEVSLRPLVKVHPETGLKNLIIGRHAHDIIGMSKEESQNFLDDLNEFACSGSRVHYHYWEPGDAVVWDNRRLMHRATPYDMTEQRRMWHTRIAGDTQTEAALNHQPS
ncbi:MAG: TauD/TfdA family dioxygenase [Actinomycetota bacterium]|nr:TauD/TfdA family dioxygenase [Actinomycetota bacterium]